MSPHLPALVATLFLVSLIHGPALSAAQPAYSAVGVPTAIVAGGVYNPLTGDVYNQAWQINSLTQRETGYSSNPDANNNAELTSCAVSTDGNAFTSSGDKYVNMIKYTTSGPVALPALPLNINVTTVALGGPSERLLVAADGTVAAGGAVGIRRDTLQSTVLVAPGWQCMSASFCSSFVLLACHDIASDANVLVTVPFDAATGVFQTAAKASFAIPFPPAQAACSPNGGFVAVLRIDAKTVFTFL
ncbi:unnamed protein product [Closterium sp. NIES-64]|nr:unnamed protein product [Closterium sp. NIES-64]